jgi:hypothetical protein
MLDTVHMPAMAECFALDSLEVMQLFTIGTVKLNPAGAVVLDDEGSPIPNYNNEERGQWRVIISPCTSLFEGSCTF